MIKTITITIAMIAAETIFTFAAIPPQALAEVSAGGTVGTSPVAPPKILSPEQELSAIPELSDLPQPELQLQ
jgi:hypothetical protein